MAKHVLKPHPTTLPLAVEGVEVELYATDAEDMLVRFVVLGGDLVVPERATPARRDGLWQAMCFEMFLQPLRSKKYHEFNFSPSTQWAAYSFDDYREGMQDLVLPVDPVIELGGSGSSFAVEVDLNLTVVPGVPLHIGLSAVVEEQGGHKSYWALTHPSGNRPDFHDPACFILELPPPLRS